ncbi:hypothetical protein B0H13DRAFT_2274571 [Mycena leptocephala]|nr:hypothetical protein B0H13DRAFT_2274571 [Mycena leptocephala]
MSNEPIILYDIPSKAPGCAWSPNTWKIRYALNFKGLAYKTVWIEYPDIMDLCKLIGAEPTMIRKNGTPYYSLPVIQDPKTGKKTFMVAYDAATEPLTSYIMPAVAKILRPKSEEYFVRTREVSFGKKLVDMMPTGEAHKLAWKEVESGFGKVDRWLNEGPNEGAPFVMGDQISFSDFMIAGELQWCLKAFGEDSELWKDMMVWHGGRWAKLFNNLKKYEGPLEDMPE